MRQHAVAGLLLAAYAALVVALMAALYRTGDEATYLGAGRAILNAGWEHDATRLHGPLPFLANQLFLPELPESWQRRGGLPDEAVFRGRLGMLPFALVAALVTYAWSRRLYGAAGGLLSLALFATNPMTLGYGGLMAVDMAYTAGVLASLWLTARYVERPTAGRAALAGIGLGAACATKYLAVFCVPVVLAGVAFGAWRAGRRGRCLVEVAGVALVSLVALHAAYGFRAGTASSDGDAYASEVVAAVVETPLVGSVVTLLPAPYLLGADYQASVGAGQHRPYLHGELAAGHADYYLWVFLHKTPEWLLLVAGVALAVALRRGVRARGGELVALVLLGTTALGLLAYLSFGTRLQLGVRYVLPLYPMAFLLCGSLAPAAAAWGRKRWVAAAAGVAALLAARDVASAWPNLISYYNPSSGGIAEGWRHFGDSNTDWGQCLIPGRRQLEEEERRGEVVILTRGAGPRFGRCAIEMMELCRADPEDPSRARHWVHAFDAVDHLGGAWWIYDVTPEAWEAHVAASGDERSRAELAVAYLGVGRLDDAERHLGALGAERGAVVAALADGVRRGEGLGADQVVDAIARWTAVGRFDRAEVLLREHPALRDDPRRDELLVHALVFQYRAEEALELARGRDVSGAVDAVLLLADLERRVNGLGAAVGTIDRWLPTLAGADADRARDARDALEVMRAREEAFLAMVRG